MMYCKCRRHLSFDILLFLAICIGGNTPLWAQSRGQRIFLVGKLSFKRIA